MKTHARRLAVLVAVMVSGCADDGPDPTPGPGDAGDTAESREDAADADASAPRDGVPDDHGETDAGPDAVVGACLVLSDDVPATLELGLVLPEFPAGYSIQLVNRCAVDITVIPPTVIDPETGGVTGAFSAPRLTRDDGLLVEGMMVVQPGDRFRVNGSALFDDAAFTQGHTVHKGELRVATTDGEVLAVPVSATMRADPCLVATPTSVGFGEVWVGATSVVEVTLENVCDQALELRGAEKVEAPGVSARLGFSVTDLEEGPNRLSHVMSPADEVDLRVSWTPGEVDAAPFAASRLVFSSSLGVVTLGMTGEAVAGACPRARISAPTDAISPGEPATVDATGSIPGEGGAIVAWRWTLTSPEGSAAALSADDAPSVHFTPDLSGIYRVTLSVTDASGVESCETVSQELSVNGEPTSLSVSLTWSTAEGVTHPPGSPAADPNIHLAHPDAGQFDLWGDAALEPWYDVQYDAFYFTSMRCDWGVRGVRTDDPSLEPDQSGPSGFEAVSLRTAESHRTYRIGVDRYRAPNESTTPMPVRPVVTVRIDGVTVATFEGEDLLPGDFWEVATVVPASGTVLPIDALYRDIDTGPHFRR